MQPRQFHQDIPPSVPVYEPEQRTTYAFDGSYFSIPERSFVTEPPRQESPYFDSAFDTDEFLAIFPEFDDASVWPRKLIEGSAKRAWFYVSKYYQCDYLDGDDRKYAHHLMVCHLMIITRRNQAVAKTAGLGANGQPGVNAGGILASGQLGTTGIVTNASVGGVSVGLSLPQQNSFWEFWLSQTPYGVELIAFLSAQVPVALYQQGDDLRLCLRD